MKRNSALKTGRRLSTLSSAVFPQEFIEQSIAVCFAKTANLYPEQFAIKGATREYTYGALNKEANKLAHALLERRAGGQIGVIAAQERAIASVLGILKAGKTYVPLDPSYPQVKLAQILHDCEIETIVTDNSHLSLARSLSDRLKHIISMDVLEAGLSTADPEVSVGPDALAAILYTSGSTGQPKGVMQSHRNILHRVMLATKAFDLGPDDRVTLLSSLTYGASLLDLYSTLLNGAVVYPFNVPEEGLSRLAAWLAREKLTVYHSVPSVWRQLMGRFSGQEDLGSVRVIRLGGDTLTTSDVELYRKHFPSSCLLFNSLNCSEAGLVRLYRVAESTPAGERVIPVGYELDGKEILVLDENNREVPHNEVGEIVIRSEFLSPGYWNSPELTSAAFRPDPEMPGHRLYYSGDLGSLLPDGCLLYKGRKDSKIKIHGINVETTQLDAALSSHPAVREAISVADEDESGERYLVAYVVPHAGATLTTTELRRFLLDLLPAHMLAANFVFLNSLPLTPNGKVDRQALRRPTGIRPQSGQGFIAPRDKWEQDLAGICQSILGIDHIGVEDNLFDLGIDSLRAVRLVTQIEKEFDQHIPPAALVGSPTVAQLAGVLRQQSHSQSWSSLFPVHPTGSKPPFFWVHGDLSNAFLPDYLGPDQPLFALDHQGQDGTPAHHETVVAIAAHYLREVRSVQASGPYFIGGYSFGGIVAFEMAHQIQRLGEKVALLFLLDPPGFTEGRLRRNTGNDFFPRPLFDSFREDVRRHFRHFAGLKTTGRIDYLWSRAFGKTKQVAGSQTRGIRNTVKLLVWKTHLEMGMRIPSWLRSAYILDIYNRARLSYEPQVYRGRSVLFRGEDLSSRFKRDWDGLLQGDVERFRLGEIDHMKLREEAYVHTWAEQLSVSLSEAQAQAAIDKQTSDASIVVTPQPHPSE
jgi:amino acid adenylation domain-containing protein